MSKQAIIIVVLSILLLAALGFIGYQQYQVYQQSQAANNYAAFNQGAQYGYEQTVTKLYSEAANCAPVQIKYNDQLIEIIKIGCPGTEAIEKALQQQRAAQQQTQS